MATLSSWRRFRQNTKFLQELYFTETMAMLIEGYYTAVCVQGGDGQHNRPVGLRACIVVDFEELCNADEHALAVLAVGFRT